MSATASLEYSRPKPLSVMGELRVPFEMLAFSPRTRHLINSPKGDGRPVMLMPGYMAGEFSMQPLATYLKILGYSVHQWGLGVNRGDVEADIGRVGERVADLHSEIGEKVTVIGWSLGGVIAREVTRMYADSVREVITMGTPIVGGPKYTSVGGFYARMHDIDLDEFEVEVHVRNAEGLEQPATSIYSRSDGIVDWKASVDPYNEHTRHVEVESSHFGLGINPKVWRVIADTLAGDARA